jgi:hypothetical protein
LDLKAIYYIYNNKSKFINLRLTIKDNVLYTNKSIIFIKGFNTILVIVTTLKELKQYTFNLHNIVLILTFYISIAFL